MNLKEQYDNLFFQSYSKVQSENFEVDDYLNLKPDNRFGITLRFRPPQQVINEIQVFLKALQAIEPNQYYYPDLTIHVTALTIISCHADFQLQQFDTKKYENLIANSLKDISSFHLSFKGITFSPSSIMIQGFFKKDTLDKLRDNLRLQFKNSNLTHTIDQRYKLETAHSTVTRFKSKVLQKQAFINLLNQYRDYNFGTFEVDRLELVCNDWYHSVKFTKILKNIDL